MFIEPTKSQLKELLRGDPNEAVTMLNLLKFASDDGVARYVEYGIAVQPLLDKAGARIVWQAKGASVVVGDDNDDAWDAVIVVRYPTRRAFIDMVSSPEYIDISNLRASALTDSRLIACTEPASNGS